MSDELVLYEVKDGVGTITFNRPEKHNAMNDEMGALMRDTITHALEDVEARCLLMRGNGKSFSSGRDITQLGRRPGGISDFAFVQHSQHIRMNMIDSSKPIIAEVKGFTLGGACELALSADIRVADSTLQMALPEVRYAIAVDTGGSVLATTLAGPSKAKYLMMTGDRIDAQTALSWNLVDFVVEPAELEDKARSIAARIASHAPLAVQMSKQLVDNMWSGAVRSALRSELMAQTALFTSKDRAEYRAALAEKRDPRYTGA